MRDSPAARTAVRQASAGEQPLSQAPQPSADSGETNSAGNRSGWRLSSGATDSLYATRRRYQAIGSIAILVGHARPRVVADLPSGVVQAPDEIDVLAELEILVKAGGERLAARNHGRRRHVPHPAVGTHERRPRTHVERGVTLFVGGDPARSPTHGDDPRRDQRHRRVGEVVEQRAREVRRRCAVGVEERDERRPRQIEPGVTGGSGPPVLAVANVAGAEPVGDSGDLARVGRPVVDDDRRPAPGERPEAALQLLAAPVDGDDDGQLAGPVGPRRRVRVGEAGVEQAPREQALGALRRRLARRPAIARSGPRRASTA